MRDLIFFKTMQEYLVWKHDEKSIQKQESFVDAI